jgi:hypothetical protein
MSMEDIMKALMQSAGGAAQQQQPAGGGDAMSQVLGGLMQAATQGSGGQAGAGSEMLTQAIGGLLGGGQQGGAGVGQLLGGLQQIIGGTPGTGQQLPMGGNVANIAASDPIMMLLQPIVGQVAAKMKISPQLAMVIASIAVHYLIQSHPNTPGASPMNLGNVMQSLSTGRKVDHSMMQNSGIVNDVMQATGMDQEKAVKSLDTTFGVLGGQVKGKATVKRAKK